MRMFINKDIHENTAKLTYFHLTGKKEFQAVDPNEEPTYVTKRGVFLKSKLPEDLIIAPGDYVEYKGQ